MIKRLEIFIFFISAILSINAQQLEKQITEIIAPDKRIIVLLRFFIKVIPIYFTKVNFLVFIKSLVVIL